MVKNLNHNDWVKQQFEKYLKSTYRNVIIHSSIIEGTLKNESSKNKFDLANKSLLNSKKITQAEFNIFDKIRDLRNKLVHESFKNHLVQNDIDNLRDSLMNKIHEAYKKSVFLEKNLLKKYNIIITDHLI
jgi:adenine-specific DNA methylase